MTEPIRHRAGVCAISARKVDGRNFWQPERAIELIDEDVLTIEIDGVGSYALMWTATRASTGAVGYTRAEGILGTEEIPEALALAVGFAFTESIIDGLDDIADMAICADRPDVVRLRLKSPHPASVRRRNVIMNSSCGICGGRDQIEQGLVAAAPIGNNLRLRISDLARVQDALRNHQDIFLRTGGAHGCAVFDARCNVLALAEDIGRHNALDKVIGEILLKDIPRCGLGVFISSRVSYEMVAKSVRAGFEVVAAISAATSMAVRTAERLGVSLCGFARGQGAEVYCHPSRIVAE